MLPIWAQKSAKHWSALRVQTQSLAAYSAGLISTAKAGGLQKTLGVNASKEQLVSLVDAYYNATLTKSTTFYKVAKNASEYAKLVNSKDVTVAVFGRNSCYHCNVFKPIYNAVAEKYNVDIYYFDSDSYNEKEYKKIMDLGLKIPAKCTESGTEALLSGGFGTPLTIITKNGKTIDCISGRDTRAGLIAKLSENGLI